MFSCKDKNLQLDYQFTNKPDLFSCTDVNMDLIKEAVYAFEKDIIPYLESRGGGMLPRAYNIIVNLSIIKNLDVNDIASDHTKAIFKALEAQPELWTASEPKYTLNYNSSFADCVIDNFLNNDFKTTTKALISVNAMNDKNFNEPLLQHYKNINNDNGLRVFLAFNYFYAHFFKTKK